MSETVNVLAAFVTVLALAVTTLAILAARRARTLKSGLLAGAFALLAAKAAFFTWTLFRETSLEGAVLQLLAFDAAVLVLLYVAIVKR